MHLESFGPVTTEITQKDANSQSRFKAIVPNKREYTDDLYCPDKEAELTTLLDHFVATPFSFDSCDFCGCVWEENQYLINFDYDLADARSNKIITGATLRVLWNTINIQIQQVTLSVNGTIDESTVERIPVTNKTSAKTVPISWDGIREINLGSILLPAKRVLAGHKFNKTGLNRIVLSSYSHEFDFATEKLKLSSIVNFTGYQDYSINGTKQNYPIPDDNKFIKFQLSSLAKDGEQTTIPFIDTQAVHTKIPSPLSGIGLILRNRRATEVSLLSNSTPSTSTHSLAKRLISTVISLLREKFLCEYPSKKIVYNQKLH
ncbi:hypothetical protein TSAR_006132 [Trichomalopsis sarcophagae]|uniref:Uncharacterized protein n=1 Tax=Trichomalopsis sarcophagae TaxID=543379 RepID=A0A232EWN0_9HYME|nr:hypothetical protein TSAR_006132 [Trichomalopsis sarcophagae]